MAGLSNTAFSAARSAAVASALKPAGAAESQAAARERANAATACRRAGWIELQNPIVPSPARPIPRYQAVRQLQVQVVDGHVIGQDPAPGCRVRVGIIGNGCAGGAQTASCGGRGGIRMARSWGASIAGS